MSRISSSALYDNLNRGHRVYGTIIVSSSPHWPSVIADCGLDFVFIDTEHMSLNRETIMVMCQMYSGVGITPVVRIPVADPGQISMMIDAGAEGIIVPYIEDADTLGRLVGPVKYGPVKGEKLEGILNKREILDENLAMYLKKRNQKRFLWAMIESKAGVENLEEILLVNGLDGVIIGPHDLSCSLNIPEQYDDPIFIEAAEKIVRKCGEHEMPCGIHFSGSVNRQLDWIKKGIRIIVHSSDLALIKRALAGDITEIKSAVGESSHSAGTKDVII